MILIGITAGLMALVPADLPPNFPASWWEDTFQRLILGVAVKHVQLTSMWHQYIAVTMPVSTVGLSVLRMCLL